MSPNRPARESRDGAELDDEPRTVRLNKYLASHGIGSRRSCDELIAAGGVMIDGEIVTRLGVQVDPSADRIEVDGVVLKPERVRHRYYLLNKPSGVVCTNDERESRPRAMDLIGDPRKGRIFTVGRLDEETVGIVLLTNDGDFANRIMHPRYGVPKTYLVKLAGKIKDGDIERLRDGVWIAEGRTAGARIRVQQRTVNQTRLFVTLQEGKNREVRRMFAGLGYKLLDLKRVRIGSLTDRGLKPGHWRPLTRSEVSELLAWTDPEQRGELERRFDRPDRRSGKGSPRNSRAKDSSPRNAGPKHSRPSKTQSGPSKPGSTNSGPANTRKPARAKGRTGRN